MYQLVKGFFATLTLIFLATAVLPHGIEGQTTAVVGATLIDGNGGPPVEGVTIVVLSLIHI